MSPQDGTTINMTAQFYEQLHRHLLPTRMVAEEAAFLFAQATHDAYGLRFDVVDWYAVPQQGFVTRSLYFLELTDETRAFVIKKAHDMECSLIEAHSHTGTYAAEFSASDTHGFEEFVPHVLWRLKKRPYAAVVMATNSMDAVAWHQASHPVQVRAVVLEDGTEVQATALTLTNHDHEH